MIKIVTISILVYLLYRLVFVPSKNIGGSPQKEQINQSANDDIIDIEYEEMD